LILAFYTFKSTKVCNFFVTRLKSLTSLETSVSDKLQTNFPAFGALNVMVSSLFVSFNFLYYLDAKTFLFYIDSYSELFTPIAFIFSVLAVVSAFIEVIIAFSCKNNVITISAYSMVRACKMLFGFFILGVCFHNHTVGGVYDPITLFKCVQSYQKYFLGAAAANAVEVRALLLLKSFGSNILPPCLNDSEFVDIIKLNAINVSLIEKQNNEILLAKKLVKDALKDYKYDFSRSDQEDQVEMLKIVSLYTKKK